MNIHYGFDVLIRYRLAKIETRVALLPRQIMIKQESDFMILIFGKKQDYLFGIIIWQRETINGNKYFLPDQVRNKVFLCRGNFTCLP